MSNLKCNCRTRARIADGNDHAFDCPVYIKSVRLSQDFEAMLSSNIPVLVDLGHDPYNNFGKYAGPKT